MVVKHIYLLYERMVLRKEHKLCCKNKEHEVT